MTSATELIANVAKRHAAKQKENGHPNGGGGKVDNKDVMRQIMRRRNGNRLGSARIGQPQSDHASNDVVNTDSSTDSSNQNTSTWAMVGNHLNESSSSDYNSNESHSLASMNSHSPDATFHTCLVDGTPATCKTKRGVAGVKGEEFDGIGGEIMEMFSPLFNETMDDGVATAEESGGCGINSSRRLYELMMNSVDGLLSPVLKSSKKNGQQQQQQQREKEVKWAIQDGWTTPKGTDGPGAGRTSANFRKSTPYNIATTAMDEHSETDDVMTPLKTRGGYEGESTPKNGMNESVVISDDEGDTLAGEGLDLEEEENELVQVQEDDIFPSSPLRDFDEAPVNTSSSSASSSCEQSGGSFDSPPSLKESPAFDEGSNDGTHVEILGLVPTKRDHNRDVSKLSPTRAALMDRNRTLVREVRFADQTCVELSEKNKYYKNEVGRMKRTLGNSNDENTRLRKSHELTMQENAKLKVLVESLKDQKHQAELQVQSYRVQLTQSEENHRANLTKCEKMYQSHLNHSENQITALNDRLNQSLAANSTLQNKLDDLHNKWESKLEQDLTSKDLILSLKERVATVDATTSKADATIQAMQNRIDDLMNMRDQHQSALQRERNEREMIEHDRDDLQKQCEGLHKQLTDWHHVALDTSGDLYFNDDGSVIQEFMEELKFTPIKGGGVVGNSYGDDVNATATRTPTSNLLARTLHSELKRRHEALDHLEYAEQEVEKLQKELSELNIDYQEALASNALLEDDLEDKCLGIAELEELLSSKDEQIGRLIEEIDLLSGATAEEQKSTTGDVNASIASSSTLSKNSVSPGSSMKEMQETAIELEGRLDVMREAWESTEDELITTRAEMAEMEMHLDETAGQLERAEEELIEAEEQITDYDEQLKETNAELDAALQELKETKDFSDFQSRTVDAMKAKLSKSQKLNKELKVQLTSCLQSLVKLEKILCTYEDSDEMSKQKLSEYGRKIARLVEKIQLIQVSLSSRDSETGSLAASSQDSVTASDSSSCVIPTNLPIHLMAQSPITTSSSLLAETPGSTVGSHFGNDSYYQQKIGQLRKELASSNERFSLIEKERDDANEELSKALSCLQEFRNEVSKQESEHTKETEFLCNKMDALASEKACLVQECRRLEAKLSGVVSDLKHYKEQNKSMARNASATENEQSEY